MDLFTNIIGYAATICLVCGYLPQAVHTMKTRQTDGIAFPTFLSMGLGSLFFTIQGLLTANIPLFIANTITTVCCLIITIIKIQNNRHKAQ